MKYYLSSEYCIKETIIGDKYLFHKATGDVYEFNDTAKFILENISNKTLSEFISFTIEIYDIDNLIVFEHELKDAIKNFIDLGIIIEKENI